MKRMASGDELLLIGGFVVRKGLFGLIKSGISICDKCIHRLIMFQ